MHFNILRDMEHYGKTLLYSQYGFPSEKIQNISYPLGFIGAYLYTNRKTIKHGEMVLWISIIVCFNIITIATVFILYKSKHNSLLQMLWGKIVGLLIGVGFYELVEMYKNDSLVKTSSSSVVHKT